MTIEMNCWEFEVSQKEGDWPYVGSFVDKIRERDGHEQVPGWLCSKRGLIEGKSYITNGYGPGK